MGILDYLTTNPDLDRCREIEREMQDNERKMKNGICPCGRNTCNCTYPKCRRA